MVTRFLFLFLSQFKQALKHTAPIPYDNICTETDAKMTNYVIRYLFNNL